jgi:hypothetical protein
LFFVLRRADPMELEELLTEAARLLARFSAEVKAASAASLTDINIASDMFLVDARPLV